jgi:hypothetical protein
MAFWLRSTFGDKRAWQQPVFGLAEQAEGQPDRLATLVLAVDRKAPLAPLVTLATLVHLSPDRLAQPVLDRTCLGQPERLGTQATLAIKG